jgi:hypothetical protein
MKKEILKKLASAANDLDANGATKLANEITDIMLKVAQIPQMIDEAKARADVFLLDRDYKNIQDKYHNLPQIEQNILANMREILFLRKKALELSSDDPRDPRTQWADSKIPVLNRMRDLLRDKQDKMSNKRQFEGKRKLSVFLEEYLQKNIGRTAGEIYDELFIKNRNAANELAAALKNLGYMGWRGVQIKPDTFLTPATEQDYNDVRQGRFLLEKEKEEKRKKDLARTRNSEKPPF